MLVHLFLHFIHIIISASFDIHVSKNFNVTQFDDNSANFTTILEGLNFTKTIYSECTIYLYDSEYVFYDPGQSGITSSSPQTSNIYDQSISIIGNEATNPLINIKYCEKNFRFSKFLLKNVRFKVVDNDQNCPLMGRALFSIIQTLIVSNCAFNLTAKNSYSSRLKGLFGAVFTNDQGYNWSFSLKNTKFFYFDWIYLVMNGYYSKFYFENVTFNHCNDFQIRPVDEKQSTLEFYSFSLNFENCTFADSLFKIPNKKNFLNMSSSSLKNCTFKKGSTILSLNNSILLINEFKAERIVFDSSLFMLNLENFVNISIFQMSESKFSDTSKLIKSIFYLNLSNSITIFICSFNGIELGNSGLFSAIRNNSFTLQDLTIENLILNQSLCYWEFNNTVKLSNWRMFNIYSSFAKLFVSGNRNQLNFTDFIINTIQEEFLLFYLNTSNVLAFTRLAFENIYSFEFSAFTFNQNNSASLSNFKFSNLTIVIGPIFNINTLNIITLDEFSLNNFTACDFKLFFLAEKNKVNFTSVKFFNFKLNIGVMLELIASNNLSISNFFIGYGTADFSFYAFSLNLRNIVAVTKFSFLNFLCNEYIIFVVDDSCSLYLTDAMLINCFTRANSSMAFSFNQLNQAELKNFTFKNVANLAILDLKKGNRCLISQLFLQDNMYSLSQIYIFGLNSNNFLSIYNLYFSNQGAMPLIMYLSDSNRIQISQSSLTFYIKSHVKTIFHADMRNKITFDNIFLFSNYSNTPLPSALISLTSLNYFIILSRFSHTVLASSIQKDKVPECILAAISGNIVVVQNATLDFVSDLYEFIAIFNLENKLNMTNSLIMLRKKNMYDIGSSSIIEFEKFVFSIYDNELHFENLSVNATKNSSFLVCSYYDIIVLKNLSINTLHPFTFLNVSYAQRIDINNLNFTNSKIINQDYYQLILIRDCQGYLNFSNMLINFFNITGFNLISIEVANVLILENITLSYLISNTDFNLIYLFDLNFASFSAVHVLHNKKFFQGLGESKSCGPFQEGSIVSMINIPNITIVNSSFINNTVEYTKNISKCLICSTQKGGALFIKKLEEIFVSVSNCRFENNTAFFGGAIYLKNVNKNETNITLTDFKNNRGIFQSNEDKQIFFDAISDILFFKENSSILQKEYRNYEVRMGRSKWNDRILSALLMDGMNNSLDLFCENDLILESFEENKLQYRFDNNESLSLYIKQIKPEFISTENINFTFKIKLRGFQREIKVIVEKDFFCGPNSYLSDISFQCELCPANTYRLGDNSSLFCKSCSDSKFIENCQQNAVNFSQGFYLPRPNSPKLFKCRNSEYCINSSCSLTNETIIALNTSSYLCSECNKNYGVDIYWRCLECLAFKNIFFIIIFLSFSYGFKLYSVRKAYKLTKNLKHRKSEIKKKVLDYDIFKLASTNSCLKIISIHFLYLFSLGSFPNPISAPKMNNLEKSNEFTFWDLVKWFSFSMECLYTLLFARGRAVSDAYFRLLAPLFIFSIWFFYYLFKIVYRKYNKIKDKYNTAEKKRQIIITNEDDKENFLKNIIIIKMRRVSFRAIILITVSICYEDILSGLLGAIAYFNENQIMRLLYQPDFGFTDFSNQQMIFTGLLGLIGVVFPIYILLRLKILNRGRNKLGKTNPSKKLSIEAIKEAGLSEKLTFYSIFFKYGYFYYPYRKQCYYYEIFYFLRKVLFIGYNQWIIPLINISPDYVEMVLYAINVKISLIWFFFWAHTFLRPYRSELAIINRLETFSFKLLLNSFIIGSVFMSDVVLLDKPLLSLILNTALKGLIIIMNVLFFIFCLKVLWNNERYNILSILRRLKELLFKRRGCCYFIKRRIGGKSTTFWPSFKRNKNRDSVTKKFLDLNPLAEFKEVFNKKELEDKKSKLKNILEKDHLKKHYKKKINLLKLKVAMQEKIIEKLKGKMKDAMFNDMKISQSSVQENKLCLNIHQLDLRDRNVRSEQDMININELESMQEEMENEESGPNKIEGTGQQAISSERLPDLLFISSPESNNRIIRNTLDKFNVSEQTEIIYYKRVIGKQPADFFIKIKVLVKHPSITMENVELNIINDEEYFFKTKRKNKDSSYKSLRNFILFIRPYKIETKFDISLNVEFLYEGQTYSKIHTIPLNKLDYLLLESIPESSKPELDKMDKVKDFNLEIKKELRKSDLLNDNWLYTLKISFPELFHNSDLEFNGTFNKMKSSMLIRKNTTDIVKSIKKDRTFTTLASKKYLKKGRLFFVREGFYIDFEIFNNEEYVVFQFENIFIYCDCNQVIDREETENIIKDFIEIRTS